MPIIEVFIPGRGLTLEGCLDLPDLSPPFPAVLLCHPNPLYGGNMDNNVIVAVSRALVQEGFAVLRFNFRGVGLSEGAFDNGIGEQEDARECLKFLLERDEIDSRRIGMGGYSFGGMIALSVGVQEDAARALAGISPVMSRDILKGCTKPKIMISGTKDELVPTGPILQEVNKAEEPGEIRIVEGADHFWWGFEEQVGKMVAEFFAGCFKKKL